jgi:lactoylglutathione lyase
MPQINLLVLKTDKLAAQVEFYSKLGFRFQYHQHGNGPFHYASEENGFVFEIYPLPKSVAEPDVTTRIGLEVNGLEVLLSNLNEINVVSAPQKTEFGYIATIVDLDGRKIELLECGA